MARGARAKSGASCAVAASGVAGPTGGTPEKPVGTIWVAVLGDGFEATRKLASPFDRRGNKRFAAYTALDLLRQQLLESRAVNSDLPKEAARGGSTLNGALPPTVVGLGLVSLFTDLSSDAIFPLLPAFLTGLGASNAFIGAIEGMADLVANILKYATGVVADRRSRLKPLVLAGYGVSTIARPFVALATAPWQRPSGAGG